MRISAQQRPRRKKSGIMTALFILAVIFALIIWGDSLVRPPIESFVEYQAKIFATRLVNEAMLEQMSGSDIQYDELVKITRNESGEVTSLESDMLKINRLKSLTSASIIEKLEKNENREISVPIGSIAGNQFTAGRGPLVKIIVTPTGYAQTEVLNKFSSAGINQTLHEIILRVNVQTIAVLPGYSVKTETETHFCIAETIVVGEIPQGYASIGGESATFAPFLN